MKDELITNADAGQVAPPDAKHLLSAVPSRLVEVGQMITSKRTGKTLKCYNVMACYIGFENRFKHWEYSFWDEDKKKCKSVRHRVWQEWLNGVWSVVALQITTRACRLCGNLENKS